MTEQEAFQIEKERIEELGLRIHGTGILTNISLGGEGSSGCNQAKSPEHRAAISESKKGKKPSASHIEAMKKAAAGKIISLAAREKISKALTGKPKSQDHRKSLSRAAKCRTLSEETRKRMAEIIKSIPKPDCAKWYEIETPEGEKLVRKNLARFCREKNLSKAHLGQVALGRRKHHKGYRARFLTLDEVEMYNTKEVEEKM